MKKQVLKMFIKQPVDSCSQNLTIKFTLNVKGVWAVYINFKEIAFYSTIYQNSNLAMLFYFQLLFHKSFGIQRQNLAVEKLAQGLAKLLLLPIMSPRETFQAVSMKM